MESCLIEDQLGIAQIYLVAGAEVEFWLVEISGEIGPRSVRNSWKSWPYLNESCTENEPWRPHSGRSPSKFIDSEWRLIEAGIDYPFVWKMVMRETSILAVIDSDIRWGNAKNWVDIHWKLILKMGPKRLVEKNCPKLTWNWSKSNAKMTRKWLGNDPKSPWNRLCC